MHDHDICFTSHNIERPVISILQVPGALNNCIEVYTLSKEFGLSGLRVAFVVGNKELIHLLQLHNYELSVMTPIFNQMVAEVALKYVQPQIIQDNIKQVMNVLVNGFRELGWENLESPHAGIAFLLPVPQIFIDFFGEKSDEVFSFYLQKYASIGVGPGKVYGKYGANFVRILSMASLDSSYKVFDILRDVGISPNMDVSPDLLKEYEMFLYEHRGYNL